MAPQLTLGAGAAPSVRPPVVRKAASPCKAAAAPLARRGPVTFRAVRSSGRFPQHRSLHVTALRASEKEEEEAAPLSLEEDFSALSDDVERLAEDIIVKLDGVSLILVGMMGCGKSTVGRLLAKTLSYCFFDSDELIEQLSGKDIPAIFAEDGEPAFREIESQVLKELGAYKTCVVSTGGGAVVERINWSYLQNGVVVYLEGPADLLARRVLADGTEGRPMLEGSDDEFDATLEKISKLLADRKQLYERADVHVSLEGSEKDAETGAPPAVVVHRLLVALKAKLDEKISMDDDAAKKDFTIEDKGPIPLGPMPKSE